METLKSREYGRFHFAKDNRPLDENHIAKLMRSIKAKDLLFLNPILINQKYEIIDGQHRFEAAKRLGIEIYYQIEQNLKVEDIILLQSTRLNWSKEAYLNFWCDKGHKEYILLRDYVRKHNISLTLAVSLTGHTGNSKTVKDFRDGKYKFNLVGEIDLYDRVKEVVDYIISIVGVSKCNYVRNNKFQRSLVLFLKYDIVDYNIFRKKLEYHVATMTPRLNITDYLDQWLEIYNYRSREPLTKDVFGF